ncbi:MAG: hypothetical protein ACPHLK_08190 [Gammaproteobacteria bacterium]|jgi:hypothetical protein
MKKLSVFILFSLLLNGCAPVNSVYYIPVSKEHAHEYKYCGNVPGGNYINNIQDGIYLRIDVGEKDRNNYVSILFMISSPHTLKLTNSNVHIKDSFGNSYTKNLEFFFKQNGFNGAVTDTLISINNIKSRYSFSTNLQYSNPDRLWLKLPSLIIDSDKSIDLQEIEMERVEKTGVMTCIQ